MYTIIGTQVSGMGKGLTCKSQGPWFVAGFDGEKEMEGVVRGRI